MKIDPAAMGMIGGKTGGFFVGDSGELVEAENWQCPESIGSIPRVLARPTPALATIYFIGPKDGPIKIGMASRAEVRVRDLRLANAYPLEIWATVEGAPSLERDYHKRFADARLHGEWFERTPALLAEIDRLQASNRGEGL